MGLPPDKAAGPLRCWNLESRSRSRSQTLTRGTPGCPQRVKWGKCDLIWSRDHGAHSVAAGGPLTWGRHGRLRNQAPPFMAAEPL